MGKKKKKIVQWSLDVPVVESKKKKKKIAQVNLIYVLSSARDIVTSWGETPHFIFFTLIHIILLSPHYVIAILIPLKLTDQRACTYFEGSN